MIIMSKESRLAKAKQMKTAFASFDLFLLYMFHILGLTPTTIQRDIGYFLEENYLDKTSFCVQAQRGEGKSLITIIFCIWCLVQRPANRIVMFSASAKKAEENATMIIALINMVPDLQYLAPDPNRSRSSTKAWEVHHDLRLPDKSASVNCMGIGSNVQGIRADVLVADDVESSVNAVTDEQRTKLKNLTLDFTSICSNGIIIYLGTPQTSKSIYIDLPERGYRVRIWTGRYPTEKNIDNYEGLLAPIIYARIAADPSLQSGGGLDGTRGKVVDDEMPILSEQELTKKEKDQGASYFDLQYMLDTSTAEANRYPLKTSRIITYDFGTSRIYPETIQRSLSVSELLEFESGGRKFHLSPPVPMLAETRYFKMDLRVGVIDPSGGGANGDETACGVAGLVNSRIFVDSMRGFKGGYEKEQLEAIADYFIEEGAEIILIEKNFGFGAFKAVFLPILATKCKELDIKLIPILDIMNTKQKELRICDVLEPVIGQGIVIFNSSIVTEEAAYLATLPREIAHTYSLFHQINGITRERKSLLHDDRIDALAIVVEYLMAQLKLSNEVNASAREAREHQARMKNLQRYGLRGKSARRPQVMTLLDRRT